MWEEESSASKHAHQYFVAEGIELKEGREGGAAPAHNLSRPEPRGNWGETRQFISQKRSPIAVMRGNLRESVGGGVFGKGIRFQIRFSDFSD